MAVVSTGQITITDVNDYTYQGTTAPKNPIPNVTVWIDTSVSPSVMKRWTGTAWEIVNEVKIGGTNLLTNAKRTATSRIVGSGTVNVNHPECPNGLYLVNDSSTASTFRMLNVIDSNGYWTISFDLKGRQNTAVWIDIGVCDRGLKRLYTTSDNTWKRVSLTAYIDNYSSAVYNFIDFVPQYAYLYLKNIKVERGTKATDWSPAPEDVDSAILTAQNSANTANNLLADIANDNILTASEKQDTKKEWDIIVGEKSVVESQANSLDVSTTSYVNAYNSLNSYITPLLANLTVNSAIVGSDFRANFKNYYDAKIALLKAVTDKLKYNTDNIQVGGRNLITKLPKEKSYPTTAFWEYFPLSEKLKEGETYILNGNVENVGGVITIGLNNLNGINNYFINLPINTPFVASNEMANRTHFSISNQTGVGTSIFKRFKLEKGNKATDWTPAPEDIQSQIDAEAQKVIDLEQKTDFLTGTTIEGNAVATGTLLVGNSDGTNAGITGIGGVNDVRFWAGSNFQNRGTANWLMRENGIEEQWFNGVLIRKRGIINGAYVEIWNNLNGQIGKKITFTADGKIQEEWYKDGSLVYQIGQNGIYYVAEIPESFSLHRLVNLNSNATTSDGSIFHNTLRSRMWQKTSNPEQFELRGDKDSYLYNAGQNVYSQGNKQYEGYKNTQSYYDNIADGWYAFEQLGWMKEDGINATKRLVDLMRVSGGKVAQQIETNVETNGYIFNQF